MGNHKGNMTKELLMLHGIYYGVGAGIFLTSGLLAEHIWLENSLTWRALVSCILLLAIPVWAIFDYFKADRDWFIPIRILGCWSCGIATAGLAITVRSVIQSVFLG